MSASGVVTIELSGRPTAEPGAFEVEIRIDGEPVDDLILRDPGSPAIEQQLSWYFEKLPTYLYDPASERIRAEKCLKEYGRKLFQQVFGAERGVRALEQYRVRSFEGCRLLVYGGMDFHRLHWEAMREPDLDEPLSVRMPLQRGIRERRITRELPGSRPSLNVLVVAARPFGAEDLDYRSITRVLLVESWKAEQPFRVDVVRPGTWQALVKHLREHENVYQVIHFDLHGTVGTAEELCERSDLRLSDATDQDPAKTTGFLIFESGRPGVGELVPASDVAMLLASSHVPVVVLNSCRSAEVPAGESSLAEWLATYGVRVVIGMAYAVTADAVTRAMPILYRAIARGDNPAMAVRNCRRQLLDNPVRAVSAKHQIKLQDWAVPVVYQQSDHFDLDLRPMTPEERSAHFSKQLEAGPEPREIVGRDFDVLAVERLLTSDDDNQVLIFGPEGVGKTEFATELLTWWWLRTGFVERAVIVRIDDGRPPTVRDIVHQVGEQVVDPVEWRGVRADGGSDVQMSLVAGRLRAMPYLLVIDSGVRALPHPGELREFLRLVRSGRTLVLVTSRADEQVLSEGTFGSKRYRLERPQGAPPASVSLLPPSEQPVIAEIPQESAPAPPDSASAVAVSPDPVSSKSVTPVIGDTAPENTSTKPGLSPSILKALIGGLVLAGVVTAVALLPRMGGTPETKAPAPATVVTTAAPAADPGWLAAAPVTGLTITPPVSAKDAKACLTVSGTVAGLTPDQTVLLAIRKTEAYAGDDFYLWQTVLDGTRWSQLVSLGNGNFQDYDIYALIADRRSADEAWRTAQGPVTSRAAITGLHRGANIRVHQSSGC